MQPHTPTLRRSLAGLALALGLVAAAGCSSDSTSTPATTTTVAGTTPDTAAADVPATTNAPATPASLAADGTATITVTVGTDDFDTSKGTRVVSVPKGTAVTIELTDPNADEQYHLHGYDLETEAKKGETGTISFTADQTGQFDLESHVTEGTLLVLVVV
jgi:hypothetical protein